MKPQRFENSPVKIDCRPFSPVKIDYRLPFWIGSTKRETPITMQTLSCKGDTSGYSCTKFSSQSERCLWKALVICSFYSENWLLSPILNRNDTFVKTYCEPAWMRINKNGENLRLCSSSFFYLGPKDPWEADRLFLEYLFIFWMTFLGVQGTSGHSVYFWLFEVEVGWMKTLHFLHKKFSIILI